MAQTQNDNIYLPLPIVITGSSVAPDQSSSPASPPLVSTQTSSMASSLIIKSSPGMLYTCYATTSTSSGYLMLFDAVAPPDDGAVTPIEVIYCSASSTSGVDQRDTPQAYSVGIVAAFSSTGPFVKTTTSNGAFLRGVAA
jgi:hypothetical protein